MAAQIGEATALVGTLIASSVDSPALGIARTTIEFSPRNLGDALIQIDGVNGYLSQVFIDYYTGAYTPDANWDLEVQDASRNPVYTKGDIAVTADINEPLVATQFPFAGTIFVNAFNMGTSTERRVKLTLVFVG